MATDTTRTNLPEEALERVFERISVQELLNLRETDTTLQSSVDEYVKHSLAAATLQPPAGPLDMRAILALPSPQAAASSSTDESQPMTQVQGVYRRLRSEWDRRGFNPQAFPKTPPLRAEEFQRVQEVAAEQEEQLQSDALMRCW